MENKIVRWGILGCSGIGLTRTMPGIASSEHGIIYAIASRSEEKVQDFARQFHPEKCYTDYQSLLDDENVDVVYIPLPNHLHYEWTIKALKKGKHVLCEKPLALTYEQALEMYQTAEENHVILMEAYAYRQAPLVQRVKQLIDDGMIGKVKYLESTHTNQVTDRTGIRFNKQYGGGAFYDVTCYNISLAGYLLEKEPLSCAVLKEMDTEKDVDTADTLLLDYGNGTVAMLYSAINCYPKGRFSILGESGRIEVMNKFNSRGLCAIYLTRYGRSRNVEIVDEETIRYSVFCEDNYALEMEQFARCILFGEEPCISPAESLRCARVMDMVMKKAQAVQGTA